MEYLKHDAPYTCKLYPVHKSKMTALFSSEDSHHIANVLTRYYRTFFHEIFCRINVLTKVTRYYFCHFIFCRRSQAFTIEVCWTHIWSALDFEIFSFFHVCHTFLMCIIIVFLLCVYYVGLFISLAEIERKMCLLIIIP